jgi:hypothetical protein
MTSQQKRQLKEYIINSDTARAVALLNSIDTTPTRTDSQHAALFLWFSMIEHEAENAGITWNEVVGHTHQLRITKEGLHVMAKQLQKALWGTTSTKELKKVGQIDILIDHFTDLFSKVGLELPPFPEDKQKTQENLGGYRVKAGQGTEGVDYPEYTGKSSL